ncbi:RNA polymerase sigma factor [candidate division KSB1 bacterium]|nr:RNA polymerase sigma factor [candidate division KSB1 bacterium]
MSDTTQQILLKCKQGDFAAFDKLVQTFQNYAYALAFRFLNHTTDAEDVVQEAFIRVWKNIKSFNMNKKFTTWFYRIVVNLCYDRQKYLKRKTRHFLSFHESNQDFFDENTNLEENITNRSRIDSIFKIVQDLPLKQKMIFILRDFQDFDLLEIAEILGISNNSVRSHLSQARRAVREKLIQLENN